MHIVEYKSIHGTEHREKYIAIPELDRYKPSVPQFIKLANLSIILDKPTAFLYVDGFSVAQSESGINTPKVKTYLPAIKSGSSYIAHQWIDTFKGLEHLLTVDIMSGTCAAGIHALYEAQRLLNEGDVKDVIIIGGERITDDTIRLFRELMIPITCGDGFFYMRLTETAEGCMHDIHDIKWKYHYNRNPFVFTEEVLNTLTPDYPVDYVKLHGTGTSANTESEAGLAMIGIPVVYKNTIGHTQGVSSLLETCLVLDDPEISGRVLVVANGLGGFYGSFTLEK